MPTKPVEQLIKSTKIGEITNPKLVQAPPETSVKAGIELMQASKAGYIVVAKNKKVVGIFTETDVAQKILDQDVNWEDPISKYMTKDPFVLQPTDSVGKAIELMSSHKFYHIPLVDGQGNLVNVLSVRTLIRFLAEFYPQEVYNLPPRSDQIMETPEGG
ncbi:MAG: CBS domain-containing protein [Candidatus Omnitrophica bacterium]|nr:CBS domain-containing protein [Candidatus Omnitrophota bacterium]